MACVPECYLARVNLFQTTMQKCPISSVREAAMDVTINSMATVLKIMRVEPARRAQFTYRSWQSGDRAHASVIFSHCPAQEHAAKGENLIHCRLRSFTTGGTLTTLGVYHSCNR